VHVVGTKGQIVIEKEIREKLGLEPGWLSVQRLVDGHVELYFVPPEHARSLKGILAPHSDRHVRPEEWDRAREAAWEDAAHVKMSADPAE
jgi:AbrB family looped-hinge helix DNA binding protein